MEKVIGFETCILFNAKFNATFLKLSREMDNFIAEILMLRNNLLRAPVSSLTVKRTKKFFFFSNEMGSISEEILAVREKNKNSTLWCSCAHTTLWCMRTPR